MVREESFCPSTLANDHLGILRLELGKEVFERTGLTGKPTRSGARKHAKERYGMTLCPICIYNMC